jgi:predicted amidohydrolase YtcJ
VVLDAYERALAQYPRRDPRHRIEYFAMAGPEQLARAAALGVVPVPQGRFASELGDGMLAAVGPDRHGWLYRQRSLLEAGMVLPGSSDRPVVAGAPLLGIADMVNRRTSSGAPFNPDEAVTAEQALRAWTWGSAYASRQEHVKGTVAPGMLADLVVLSEDPTAVSPERIAGLEVLATVVGGEVRYGSLDLPAGRRVAAGHVRGLRAGSRRRGRRRAPGPPRRLGAAGPAAARASAHARHLEQGRAPAGRAVHRGLPRPARLR